MNDTSAGSPSKTDLSNLIDDMAPDLLRVSHEIHANPELAFKEHHACKTLVSTAAAAGMNIQSDCWGLPTAFDATFGARSGPIVDIIAEYDALPGIGHACGHNLIATSALGAAMALHKYADQLPGRIRFLGTPAEERGGGKEIMGRNGAFEHTDAAMMIHPAGINLATMPSICIAEVKVEYRGKSAHASAMPHKGVNALDGVLLAYHSVANLRQHIRGTERIHGIITAGGDAPNIIPEYAAAEFYVRAANERHLAQLKPRVQACFEAGATGSGSEVTVTWADIDYLDLNTNWPLAEVFQKNAETLGRDFIPMEKLGNASMGSTDMGNVSYRVPSIHPMLACAPPSVVIHHPDFAKYAGSEQGDAAALDGAKALAMTALDYLLDPALQSEAKKAFDISQGLAA